MDPLEFLVVGEEGCTLNDIVKVFLKEVHSVAVSKNWRDFARELRINPAEIEKWRKDTELLDKLTLTDVLHKILESWKEKEGKDATLPNLLNHLEKVDLKNIADELREFFSTGNRLQKGRQVFKHTLPNKPRYYIPRTLITRRVINAKVFSSTHNDIFVVDGIDRYRLSQLAGRELTDTSTKQVRKHELSVRFILLERFGDWALLCGKAKNPIHLLRNHEGRFHWISTNGDISALQRAIDEKNQNELSEETFIREIETDRNFQTNQPICISDSPGMGKSLLLASIGRQLQQMHPQPIVAFIVISEFVVKVRELFPKFSKREKAVLEALSQILCENDPARKQFVQKIKTPTEQPSRQIELMFDGFDEVSTENLHFAHECLDTLTTDFNNAIRVWVTTRPQHLQELEKRFSVLGYSIEAFQEEQQIKFLTSFWNTEEIMLDGKKLEKYSKTCLSTLKKKLNKKDNDIAGIPLQCMMIAEVYKEDAHLFCDSNNDGLKFSPPVPDIDVNSIADLYQKMIEHKVNKFIRTYRPVQAQINSIWSQHMYLALELIFPSHAHEFKDTLQINSPLDMDFLLNIGILERRGSTTKDPSQFIHRTFAEYLSARFFVFNVIAPGTANWINASKKLPRFLFEHVLECSVEQDKSSSATYYKCSHKNSVLCHFLDLVLDSQATNYARNCISQKSTDSMKNVIYACIHSDFGNIVKFLRALNYPDSFPMNYLESRILIDASSVASLDLLKFLLEDFEHEPHSRALTAVPKEDWKPQSVLHAAVCRGSYSIFAYILKEVDLKELAKKDEVFLDLVYWTVRNTAGGNLDEIRDRVQIVTALYDLNREMINYCDDYETPLLADKVNIVLLKKLIECGANLLHIDNDKNTILHKATEYLSPTDYLQLLQFIRNQTLIRLLQMTNYNGETCFHLIVKRGLATPDILSLILSNEIDINISGAEGRTCIFYAVEMKNEEMRLSTVKMLLEKGADHTCVDLNGDSIVHCSAWNGQIDCLQFFLKEKKVNVDQINKFGETPIFTASYRSTEFLLDHGADYKILNSYGQNLLHKSAQFGGLECLELFLSVGELDINQVDNFGNTPLLCALVRYSRDKLERTTLLLDKGADHTISNEEGNNALHLSAQKDNDKCFSRFVRLPWRDVNARNWKNDTPLHILCRNIVHHLDDYDTLVGNIEHLLSLGADVNAKNNNGKTPVDIFEFANLECEGRYAFISSKSENGNQEDLDQKCLTITRLLGGKGQGDSHDKGELEAHYVSVPQPGPSNQTCAGVQPNNTTLQPDPTLITNRLKNMIIGSEDLSISIIVMLLSCTDTFTLLENSWLDLPICLNLSPADIDMIRRGLQEGKTRLSDAIFEILLHWKSVESNNATLQRFLSMLEKNNLNNVANCITNYFSIKGKYYL